MSRPNRREALGTLAAGAITLASRRARAKERTLRLPVGFVGHGAPSTVLDLEKSQAWIDWGASLTGVRSVLVVSAHWEGTPVRIGATRTLPLIYDFRGFPAPLYEVQYPAPGAPKLANRVAKMLGAGAENAPTRGLDHGAWTPLVHMFPDMETPVLQISLPSRLGAKGVFELGRRLSPLRREGVFLLGSGSATHNLRAMAPDGSAPRAFAVDFDAWLADVTRRRDFDALLDAAQKAPAFRQNHPTPEHWLPLLFAAGAASEPSDATAFPVTGWEYGNLSRRSFQFG